MDDNPENFSDNYNLYMASKKKGTAKDDFPSKYLISIKLLFVNYFHILNLTRYLFVIGLSLVSNVKLTNTEHFSLSCFSKAFLDINLISN